MSEPVRSVEQAAVEGAYRRRRRLRMAGGLCAGAGLALVALVVLWPAFGGTGWTAFQAVATKGGLASGVDNPRYHGSIGGRDLAITAERLELEDGDRRLRFEGGVTMTFGSSRGRAD